MLARADAQRDQEVFWKILSQVRGMLPMGWAGGGQPLRVLQTASAVNLADQPPFFRRGCFCFCGVSLFVTHFVPGVCMDDVCSGFSLHSAYMHAWRSKGQYVRLVHLLCLCVLSIPKLCCSSFYKQPTLNHMCSLYIIAT